MIKTQVEKKTGAKNFGRSKSNHIMPVLLTCSIGRVYGYAAADRICKTAA